MHVSHHNIQAIFLVCLGWLSFSVADMCAKILVQHYDVSYILLTNGVIGVTLSAIWLISRCGINGLRTPFLKWHILRAICTTGSSFSVVNALNYLPLADFYGISFISPFLIALLSFLLLGEKVGWRRITAMMVAFVGVLIIAGPQYQTHNIGLVWAFLAPVCLAFNVLCVRKIGHSDPIALFALFPFILIAVMNGALFLPGHDYTLPELHHLPFFFLAACSVIGGLVGTSLGFARASESAVVAPFLYTQMIWGIIIGIVVFATIPTMATMAGAALIIGAGLFSFYREYRLAHPKA